MTAKLSGDKVQIEFKGDRVSNCDDDGSYPYGFTAVRQRPDTGRLMCRKVA